MSDRTPDEKLRELVGLFEAMDEGGAPPPLLGVLVGETHTALTELLALRAEVERLRSVEYAAQRVAEWSVSQLDCPHCTSYQRWERWRPHRPYCLLLKLHAALDAEKKEPTT